MTDLSTQRVQELPSGTVTFLFTDVEGSTVLWEQAPEAMRAALSRHDILLREAIGAHGGHVVKTAGDGFHAAFARAPDALAAQRRRPPRTPVNEEQAPRSSRVPKPPGAADRVGRRYVGAGPPGRCGSRFSTRSPSSPRINGTWRTQIDRRRRPWSWPGVSAIQWGPRTP